ncbi:RNA-binding protein [Candidatus Falkowbacteria bacterium CG10_big_fil_rev_8_21_14_0_10_39_9]|uniref:RNA-binding protein n=1 Tax=Candidatus Falkowbacteria bacterium CG10_big_fil_rev_8_21_14_0_10_39_9 TaxID=1974566 RepID=A0A2M6WPV1_9BACT|nr:MAG: RNA-binding protein [Candidatus Falkowbacteria bacterium CG10_big_fil_rev_8_21_14_0_10_39_9]
MKKLFIGGLPYSFGDDALSALFADCGNVESAVIIKDRMTGRSKGFGFVEMSSEAEAEKAISMFNGQEVEGRRLNVSIARPMTEGPRR